MAIKRTPEDFKVQELLSEQAQRAISPAPADWAVYELTKRGLTTPEACIMLARRLGVPADSVVFAALKDKHALTSQHVSVQGKPDLPQRVDAEDYEARRLGWCDQPLEGAAIAANRFQITLYALSERDCRNMDGAAELLSVGPDVIRIVNYFGPQRFGAIRHGGDFPARRLIADDFEQALRLIIATPAPQDQGAARRFRSMLAEHWGRWRQVVDKLPANPMLPAVRVLAGGGSFRDAFAALPYFIQQMNVESYQSYLWNAAASGLIVQLCPDDRVWEAKDKLELMRFVSADATTPVLERLVLPLLAPRTRITGPAAGAYRDVLAHEGIRQADLRVPGMRKPFFGESPRLLMVEATDLSLGAVQKDPSAKSERWQRTVSFQLPRGAYATVVLSALGQ